MIYLLSDLHGSMQFPGLRQYLSASGEGDLLLILGDVGLNFEDSPENREFTETLLQIQKNIAFLDGNHENFSYLYRFPEEDWNGGKVHRLTDHIVHLERGNIYTIEGKTFFVFGGCKSSAKWKEMGLWYPEEEATPQEYVCAYRNLERCKNRVDYILTHKYAVPDRTEDKMSLEGLTAFLDEQVSFTRWYSGHWHENRRQDGKHIIVYDLLCPLE